MIKKITAYSFIILANIVLLAHAVVSHHHHQDVVCVETAHCQDNNITHKHHTPEDNHQHDSSSSTNCLLKQAVIVVSSNQGKNETNCVFCTDNHSLDLHFTQPYNGYEAIIPIFIVASLPDVSFSFSSYITSSIGLRAPPLV